MDSEPKQKTIGRTWVDLWVGSGYVILVILFIVGLFVGAYYAFGEIPQWIFISIIMSFAFIPFLFDRAKEDSKLYLVCDEPLKLTEYRIGSKVNMDLKGVPARMTSLTGVQRLILKKLDKESMIGIGSPLGEYSQFEQIRTMSTLQNLTNKLEEVLKEDRLTSMQTGIEVEKQSKKVVDWALRVVYGSAIPHELSEALGIDLKDVVVDETVEEALQ
jgi:hypothetical protein